MQTQDRNKTIEGCTNVINSGVANNQRHFAFALRGGAHHMNGDLFRAIADYDQAIRIDPKFASAWSMRCMAYFQRYDYDRAMADCSQALRLDSSNSIAYAFRGKIYLFKDRLDLASADFDRAIQSDSNNSFGFSGRGWIRMARNQSDLAFDDFNRAIRLNPQDAYAYHGRGALYYAKGDYNQAIAEYNEAIRIDPINAYPYGDRAAAYIYKGDYDRAIADYDQVLRLNPRLGDAENYRRRTIAHRDSLRAKQNVTAAAPTPAPSTTPAPAPAPAPTQATAAPMGKRVALVIGNSGYHSVTRLTNPANDARDIAGTLTSLGFDVIVRYDLGVEGMRRSLGEFEEKATGSDWALVYYAGHGIEFDGRNWLIPVDAKLGKSSDIPDEAISLDRVLERVQPAKRLRMVILDACRNSPFLPRMAFVGGKTRSVERGLARVEPIHGEVVFFAARAGSVASDGNDGGHSPFAAALLKYMKEPGLELGRFFRKVTGAVRSSTDQEPFYYGSLPEDDFYFTPPQAR